MTQYHFLDDSGDPGLSGSSFTTHLVLAMVQLADSAPLTELAVIRRLLNLSPSFEFKYHTAKPRQKAMFFELIQTLSFRVRTVVVTKSKLEERFARMNGQEWFVEFTSGLALRASERDLVGEVLIIDGGTPSLCRALRVRLSEECRRMNRVRPFKKIVGGRSKSEDGLQLADMIAGATRRYFAAGEREYYKSFERKIVDLWQVPGE